MIIQLIGTTLSVLSPIIMVIIAIQMPFRRNISYNIHNGTICYRCKVDIPVKTANWMISGNGKRQMCKSCTRDVKLDSVMGNRKIYLTLNSRDSLKVQMCLGIFGIVFTIIGFAYKPIGVLGSLFVFASTLYWMLSFFSTTKRKKFKWWFRK